MPEKAGQKFAYIGLGICILPEFKAKLNDEGRMGDSFLAEIKSNLEVPIKSFRIYALEKAISNGSGSELLEYLNRTKEEETDIECLLMYSHAIHAVREKLAPPVSHDQTPLFQGSFSEAFKRSTPEEKLDLLRKLSPNLILENSGFAPDLLKGESDPAIQTRLAKTFGKCWPKDRLQDLSNKLSSGFLSVQMAVLEVLGEIAPRSLLKKLPSCLSSNDPRIRVLAIKGLAQIDLEEAVLHLKAMLFSRDSVTTSFAIENMLFLSFEDVKRLLYEYLAWETNLDFVEKAGFHIILNPEIESLYVLWETGGTSSGKKSEIIRSILDQTIQAIESRGILGESLPDFLKQFSMWQEKRKKEREQVGTFFAEFHEKESQAAEFPEPNVSADTPSKNVPSMELFGRFSLSGVPVGESLKLMDSWEITDAPSVQPVLEALFRDRHIPPEMKAAAIRVSTRLGLTVFGERISGCLDSQDSRIACAALQYFAAHDPEKLSLVIGKFIGSSNHRVKSTALEILKTLDPAQALSMIFSMLSSPNRNTQAGAFSCLPRFDFSIIRERLFGCLQRPSTPEFLKMGLLVFQLNPEKENLYFLNKLEKNLPPQHSHVINETRSQNEKALQEMGLLTPEELNDLSKGFEKRRKNELERQTTPKPYSVESTRKIPGTLPVFWGQFSNELLVKLMVPIALFFLGSWILTAPEGKPRPQAKSVLIDEVPSFRQMVVSGIVEEILQSGKKILVRDSVGKKYLVIIPDGQTVPLTVGSKFQALIVPYQTTQDGKNLAEMRKFLSGL